MDDQNATIPLAWQAKIFGKMVSWDTVDQTCSRSNPGAALVAFREATVGSISAHNGLRPNSLREQKSSSRDDEK